VSKRSPTVLSTEMEFGVHAVLVTLHGLAAFWHLQRRAWVHSIPHLVGVGLDGFAALRHLRSLARENNDEG